MITLLLVFLPFACIFGAYVTALRQINAGRSGSDLRCPGGKRCWCVPVAAERRAQRNSNGDDE